MITLTEKYGKPVKNAQTKALRVFFQVTNDLISNDLISNDLKPAPEYLARLFKLKKIRLIVFPLTASYSLSLFTAEIDFIMERVETNIAQNLNFHRRSETTRYGATLGT